MGQCMMIYDMSAFTNKNRTRPCLRIVGTFKSEVRTASRPPMSLRQASRHRQKRHHQRPQRLLQNRRLPVVVGRRPPHSHQHQPLPPMESRRRRQHSPKLSTTATSFTVSGQATLVRLSPLSSKSAWRSSSSGTQVLGPIVAVCGLMLTPACQSLGIRHLPLSRPPRLPRLGTAFQPQPQHCPVWSTTATAFIVLNQATHAPPSLPSPAYRSPNSQAGTLTSVRHALACGWTT